MTTTTSPASSPRAIASSTNPLRSAGMGRSEGQQRDVPRPLDGAIQGALIVGRKAGVFARKDTALIRHELTEGLTDVLHR